MLQWELWTHLQQAHRRRRKQKKLHVKILCENFHSSYVSPVCSIRFVFYLLPCSFCLPDAFWKEAELIGLRVLLTFVCCLTFAIFFLQLPTMCLLLGVVNCPLLFKLCSVWIWIVASNLNCDRCCILSEEMLIFLYFIPTLSILVIFSLPFGRQERQSFQQSYALLCIQLFMWLSKDHGQTSEIWILH